MTNSILIGIAGGTGSGKTTLAYALRDGLGKDRSCIISQDSYYKDRSEVDSEERKKINFDEPAAFDFTLLSEHLRMLKNRKTIENPIYDYKTHTRTKKTKKVTPADFIILEGLLILSDERVRSILDLKIYIEVAPEVRFQRRLNRDIKERGRTEESVIEQYQKTVFPMHYKYVEPSRKFADIVVSGEKSPDEMLHIILQKLPYTMVDK